MDALRSTSSSLDDSLSAWDGCAESTTVFSDYNVGDDESDGHRIVYSDPHRLADGVPQVIRKARSALELLVAQLADKFGGCRLVLDAHH